MHELLRGQILKHLKRKKGCTAEDFFRSVPEYFWHTDAPPQHYLREALAKLLQWRLIEAYKDGTLLNEDDDTSSRGVVFYLSPIAVELEQQLGIDLTAIPIFGQPISSTQWPAVLALMPFAPVFRPVYEDHLKAVAKRVGLSIGRADDFFSNGSIMADIWSAIHAADIILADCTGRNPNVFYEIGIAHTLGRDTILLTRSVDDIPFDLRHLRTIVYDFTPRGMATFEEQCQSTIQTLLERQGMAARPRPAKTKRKQRA